MLNLSSEVGDRLSGVGVNVGVGLTLAGLSWPSKLISSWLMGKGAPKAIPLDAIFANELSSFGVAGLGKITLDVKGLKRVEEVVRIATIPR